MTSRGGKEKKRKLCHQCIINESFLLKKRTDESRNYEFVTKNGEGQIVLLRKRNKELILLP